MNYQTKTNKVTQVIYYVTVLIFFIYVVLMIIDSAKTSLKIRVGTYNLLNPVFEEKYHGKNTWDERLPFIVENVLFSNCDILCFEEMGQKNYDELVNDSQIKSKYKTIYLSHSKSSEKHPEGRDGLALFYDPIKLNLVEFEPSKRDKRPTHRNDFTADFSVNLESKEKITFRLSCTHLDSSDEIELGKKQLESLLQDDLLQDNQKHLDFIVVLGDFNEGEAEKERPRYNLMTKYGFLTDGSTVSTRTEDKFARHKGHVDWIFVKNLSKLKIQLKAVPPLGNEKASDHKLTMTDINFLNG